MGSIKLMIRPESEMIYEQLPPPSSSRLSSKFNRTFDSSAVQKPKNPVISLSAKPSNLIKQLN
jgi:hypothetical protein